LVSRPKGRTYFENRVLMSIFGPKKWREAGEDCIMRSFITSTFMFHQIWVLFGDQVKKCEIGRACSTYERNEFIHFCRKT